MEQESKPSKPAEQPPKQPSPPPKPRSVSGTLQYAIEQKRPQFEKLATKYLTAERLVRLAQLTVSRIPELQKCTVGSIVAVLMDCASLGLEPHTPGGIWMVPFKDKSLPGDQRLCTGIVDYRGMLDVARRSKQIVAAVSDIRYEKDEWQHYVDALAPSLTVFKHRLAEEDRGRKLGAYAAVRLVTGGVHVAYLTVAEIEVIKKRSRGAESKFSPWHNDPEAMERKTAVRRVVNLLPRSDHLQTLREVLAKEDEEQLEPQNMMRARIQSVAGIQDAEFEMAAPEKEGPEAEPLEPGANG